MATAKLGETKDKKPLHYSAGALIEKDGTYLLIDRKKVPLGFAGVGGHVDEGETDEEALIREVKEETGLDVESFELLYEEDLPNNTCSRGVDAHHWKLYKCIVSGEPILDENEAKSMDWYSVEEIKELELEPAWKYWFEKLNLIS